MSEQGNIISFDTARTVLLPAELLKRGEGRENGDAGRMAADYLRFNGMALAAGETAVVSESCDGIVAVMAVSTDDLNRRKDQYERGEVRVTSPLLCVATGGADGETERYGDGKIGGRKGRAVDIILTETNAYMAVRENGLKMAEALPENSVDSLLYYMQVAGQQFKLRKFDIRISGPHAEQVADALRQYYKKVTVC